MSLKERSILRVEGKDDHHAIRHLLKRHGVDPLSVDIKGAEQEDASDKNKLLTGMKAEVMTSNDKAIGFVLDADGPPKDLWDSVRGRLKGLGLNLPNKIPEDGFVGDMAIFQARVGVWLMPDNRRSGAVEEFCKTSLRKETHCFNSPKHQRRAPRD